MKNKKIINAGKTEDKVAVSPPQKNPSMTPEQADAMSRAQLIAWFGETPERMPEMLKEIRELTAATKAANKKKNNSSVKRLPGRKAKPSKAEDEAHNND